MKIGLKEITKLIEDCKAVGHDVKMDDIAYVFLLQYFKDKEIPYKTLFNKNATDSEVNAYNKSPLIKFLKKYIDSNFCEKQQEVSKESVEKGDDITFGENKEQLIKNLETIKEMRDKGELDAKDFIKLDIEIRTKLIDKFAVSEKQDEQRVIVYKKYNDICVCGREIYRPTRDDIIEDLKKTYNLVPKENAEIEEEDGYNE